MHVLTNTNTDKLTLKRSTAATLDCVVSYADNNAGTITESSEKHAFSSAATGDICATPGASTVRKVKEMTVRNKDGSLSCDVTVIYNGNGTEYELIKVTLNTGDSLEYVEGAGFFLITSTAKLDFKGYVSADIARSATGMADVTGLTCPVKAGHKYAFEAWLMHISASSVTGFQASVNGPTMNNVQIATIDTVTASVTAAAVSGGASATLDTAATAQTTGSAAITGGYLAGGFEPSADGTFAIRWTPETAATVTIKRGSWCRVWETDN